MGLLDKTLFEELAREAELRVSEFNAQSIANTAWAFANRAPKAPKRSQRGSKEALGPRLGSIEIPKAPQRLQKGSEEAPE